MHIHKNCGSFGEGILVLALFRMRSGNCARSTAVADFLGEDHHPNLSVHSSGPFSFSLDIGVQEGSPPRSESVSMQEP